MDHSSAQSPHPALVIALCSGVEVELHSCKDNLQAIGHNTSLYTTHTHTLIWQYLFDLPDPRSRGSYKICNRSLSTKVGALPCLPAAELERSNLGRLMSPGM